MLTLERDAFGAPALTNIRGTVRRFWFPEASASDFSEFFRFWATYSNRLSRPFDPEYVPSPDIATNF